MVTTRNARPWTLATSVLAVLCLVVLSAASNRLLFGRALGVATASREPALGLLPQMDAVARDAGADAMWWRTVASHPTRHFGWNGRRRERRWLLRCHHRRFPLQ